MVKHNYYHESGKCVWFVTKFKDRVGGANPPPTIQAAPVISPGPQQQAAMSNADFQVLILKKKEGNLYSLYCMAL